MVSGEGNIVHSKEAYRTMSHIFVPVVDQERNPLMPTTPSRARKRIKSGKATHFWKGGLFCIRLNVPPSARVLQLVAVGLTQDANAKAIVSPQPPTPTSISCPRPESE